MKKLLPVLFCVLSFSCVSNLNEKQDYVEVEDQWALYEGTLTNGYPIIMRKNIWFEDKENLPWKIGAGIAFYVNDPTANGFPSSTENQKLYQLEDKLFEIFEKDQNSVVTLIITAEAVREFVLYTRDVEIFQEDLEQLQSLFPEYDLTFYTRDDPEWGIYNEY